MKAKSKVLIIAGSDSSGGAGIQADIKTVTSLGGYAMTAITAITAQNTTGVISVVPISPREIEKQILFTCLDIKPDAIKIGMLHSSLVINSVIKALKKIQKGSKVQIFTDSKYVKSGITEWIHNWKKNGWKTANKKEVSNKALWTELDLLNNEFEISWNWVKAHSTDELNNEVDLLAKDAANL